MQCEFDHLKDSLIKDRIVCGITNESCRERLLRENDLNLARAIDICRAAEVSEQQLKLLHKDEYQAAAHAVSKMRVGRKPVHNRHGSGKQHVAKKSFAHGRPQGRARLPKCEQCGQSHEKDDYCPAVGKTCYNCKGKNHFSKLCKSKKNRHNVHVVDKSLDDDSSDSDLFLGVIGINSVTDDEWMEDIVINSRTVRFKLDSGAQANIIPLETYDKLKLRRSQLDRQTKGVNLVTYDENTIDCEGVVYLPCIVRGQEHRLKFYVTTRGSKPILGQSTSVYLNLIQRVPVHSVELSKDNIVKQYSDVFTGLGKLPGTYHIETDPSVAPVVHPPRKVPSALQKQVREELNRMESLGVIAKQDEPTDWVHSMVIVRKPGKIRVCIDPKDLNPAIKREHYHLVTVEEIAERLPNAKVFSKFDATHGFWHVELDDESSKLLTFNTPFGRYRYRRLPFGITSAPEVFSKRLQELFIDLPGVECLVDDILVHGETDQEHDENVLRLLERCRQVNLKLNKQKVELRVNEVKYVGHVISKDGLKVDPEKVNAIVNMPAPTDVQSVRRFLGLVQYVAKFIPNMADLTAPLRELTKNDVAWHWDKPQKDSFDRLKQVLSSTPVLKFYNLQEDVTISVDPSSKGLGAVLLQNQQPVAFASRALTETQSRYAQIEREMLAVLYGCEKFHHYIYGRTVTIETDHKPLLAIHRKPLYQATPRLQRMLMKLQRYDVHLTYVPGKEMYISDALSRAYLEESTETLIDEDLDVNFVERELPMTSEKIAQLKQHTATDEQLQLLADIVAKGWPEKRRAVPHSIRAYWNYRDEIAYIEGLMYRGSRIIIPSALRRDMLNKLHEPHLGIVKTKQRARSVIFWPNMNQDIERLIEKCDICNKHRKANPHQPLIPHDIPELPWSKVGADLFQFKNNEYLLCVDYYSKYPEIVLLPDMSSATTISAFKSVFARHGIPSELFTDNGPQFANSNFKKFASDWEFTHSTSSPRYPRSNGQAERCVQTVKNLLRKAEDSGNDVYIALLEYRASPLDGVGLSPSQLLMNRQLRTKLPTAPELLKPLPIPSQKAQLDKRQEAQKYYHDKHAVVLPEIEKDEIVRMRNPNTAKWEPAIVQEDLGNRSFRLRNDRGRIYRRNREHILKSREMSMRCVPTHFEFPEEQPKSNPIPTQFTRQPQSDPSTSTTTRSGRVSRKPSYLSDYV